MLVSRQSIEKSWLILTLFVYAISSYFIMPSMDNQADLGTSDVLIYELLSYAISIPYLLIAMRPILQKKQNRVIWFFVLFFIWAMIASLLSFNGFSSIFYSSFPLFPLLLAYTYSRRYGMDNIIHNVIFISFLLICYQYFHIFQVANVFHSASAAHIGVSYFPMLILPIVLLHPSKIFRLIAWLLVSIIIISSIKRGGILALAIGTLVYIFCKQYISNSSKLRTTLWTVITISIMAVGLIYVINIFESDIFERMLGIGDDEGSGRGDIWRTVINNILNSNPFSFLFGHGYLSVSIISANGHGYVPAHNDFLEVFYDYGLIGMFSYCVAWLLLVRYTFRLLHRKSELAPPFCLMITFFFILSMVSIVLYYFWITYICLMLGLIIGQDELLSRTNALQSHE